MIRIYLIILICLLLVPSTVQANPVKAVYDQGVIAYVKKDYKKAIVLMEQTIKMYPQIGPAHYYLAMSKKELGLAENEYLPSLEMAVALDHKLALAHEAIGKIYYSRGEYDKAEKHCLAALESDPRLLSSRLSLGWIYLLGRSQPAKAITYFKPIAESSEISYVNFGLGMAYFLTGNRPLVLEMITRLRTSGQDNLAKQLGDIMRGKRQLPELKPGSPLFGDLMGGPPKPKAVPDHDVTIYDLVDGPLETLEGAKLKVRLLRPSMHSSSPVVIESSEEEILSGQDRIKELQNKARTLDLD